MVTVRCEKESGEQTRCTVGRPEARSEWVPGVLRKAGNGMSWASELGKSGVLELEQSWEVLGGNTAGKTAGKR